MSRIESAKEYFLNGYACSQAVVLAFADVIGLEEEAICKIMLPFGGGLGRLRLTCGAVSGMAAVIGMVFSSCENSPENKKETYAIVRELCGKFQEKTGSLICSELLSGVKASLHSNQENASIQKHSCAEIVGLATQILEDYMRERGVL